MAGMLAIPLVNYVYGERLVRLPVADALVVLAGLGAAGAGGIAR